MVARLLTGVLLAAASMAQPHRIVSTAPSITEMLYALGLGDRVVGVTTFCHYPPEATRKPKIGNYLRPDVEAVLALRPDLVIAEKSMVRQAVSLPRLKLNVLEVDDATIAGIRDSLRTIGRATGTQARADILAAEIQSGLEAVRQRTLRLSRPRAMFVVGRTPGRIEDLIAAGGSSYLDELVRIAGGENVFHDAAAAYPKVGLEEVLARDPDVIIDMGEMAQTVGVTEQDKRAVVSLWRHYPSLSAVKRNRVFAVASDIFVVPGPRVVQAARQIAAMLHPEPNP
jgi:iron complex transport system substrate-binding protein